MPDIRCSECGRIVKVQGLAATCPYCGNLVAVAPVESGYSAPAAAEPPLAHLSSPDPTPPPAAIPVPPPPGAYRVASAKHETHPGWYVLWATLTVIVFLITIDWMRLRFFARPQQQVVTTVAPTP